MRADDSPAFFIEAIMKRSTPKNALRNKLLPRKLSKKAAIHEAGHAAAIHLGNKQKQLPPVYFQICFNDLTVALPPQSRNFTPKEHSAKIDGGRLIHTLPLSIQEEIRYFSEAEALAYQSAFEADIVNLLVGPLAEAKYVALSDDEPINPRLVNLNSLHNYGGLQIWKPHMSISIACSQTRLKRTGKYWNYSLPPISLSITGRTGVPSPF
jgi:hypothetical protein